MLMDPQPQPSNNVLYVKIELSILNLNYRNCRYSRLIEEINFSLN